MNFSNERSNLEPMTALQIYTRYRTRLLPHGDLGTTEGGAAASPAHPRPDFQQIAQHYPSHVLCQGCALPDGPKKRAALDPGVARRKRDHGLDDEDQPSTKFLKKIKFQCPIVHQPHSGEGPTAENSGNVSASPKSAPQDVHNSKPAAPGCDGNIIAPRRRTFKLYGIASFIDEGDGVSDEELRNFLLRLDWSKLYTS